MEASGLALLPLEDQPRAAEDLQMVAVRPVADSPELAEPRMTPGRTGYSQRREAGVAHTDWEAAVPWQPEEERGVPQREAGYTAARPGPERTC